jgi:hypothetical protein
MLLYRFEPVSGGPGQIRTADLRFRKPSLYPSELQGHTRRNPIISLQLIEVSTARESALVSEGGTNDFDLRGDARIVFSSFVIALRTSLAAVLM